MLFSLRALRKPRQPSGGRLSSVLTAEHPGILSEAIEVAFFAAINEPLGNAFEVAPSATYGLGFVIGDLRIGGSVCDEREKVGKLLGYATGRGSQELVLGRVGLWVLDKETTGLLAQSMDAARVTCGSN